MSDKQDSNRAAEIDLRPRSYVGATFLDLPFVYRPKKGNERGSNWHLPPASSYEEACDTGEMLAAHFLKWMAEGDCGMPMLQIVVAAIDFTEDGPDKGYWVGFLSMINRYARATARAVDPFDDLAGQRAYYTARRAQAAAEETERRKRISMKRAKTRAARQDVALQSFLSSVVSK